MQTTFISINNVFQEVLIVASDTEQAYSSIIEDGDMRYYVTPYRSFQQDGKYYYWFIVQSKEVVNQALKQQIEQMQGDSATVGQTVAGLSLQGMQLNSALDAVGKQLAQAQIDIIALKGGTKS